MRQAAVIGCGRMGAFTSEAVRRFAPAAWFPLSHADAIAAHPDLELAALCDPDPAALAKAGAAHPGALRVQDHRALLEAFTPDLAAIATRTIGRAQIIADLAQAGTRAFHIEKPLCNSTSELDALAGIFAAPDLFATLGTVRRFFPIVRHASAIVESGALGPLREIRVSLGAGALFWVHPHSVDLILAVAGTRAPVAVQAVLGEIVEGREPGVIDNDPQVRAATIWCDDGVAGHIGCGAGADLVLACEGGSVSVVRDGESLFVEEAIGDDPYLVRRAGAVPEALEREPGGTLGPISQLAACLAGDVDAIAANRKTKNDILLGQRILFVMVESSRRGGVAVRLPGSGAPMTIWARTGSLHA